MARVQSTIKSQIAYSSAAQIGLMFVEVALGWKELVYLHFAANAFLRTYQLLVSPAVLSYLIHDQFFHFNKPSSYPTVGLWSRLRITLYQLSLLEFRMNGRLHYLLWNPLKTMARNLTIFQHAITWLVTSLYLVWSGYTTFGESHFGDTWFHAMPYVSILLSLTYILSAFGSRGSARKAWVQIMLSQCLLGQAIATNEQFEPMQLLIYFSGVALSFGVGLLCLQRLYRSGIAVSLERFQGYSFIRPRLGVAFLIACMGMSGFPITPTLYRRGFNVGTHP